MQNLSSPIKKNVYALILFIRFDFQKNFRTNMTHKDLNLKKFWSRFSRRRVTSFTRPSHWFANNQPPKKIHSYMTHKRLAFKRNYGKQSKCSTCHRQLKKNPRSYSIDQVRLPKKLTINMTHKDLGVKKFLSSFSRRYKKASLRLLVRDTGSQIIDLRRKFTVTWHTND